GELVAFGVEACAFVEWDRVGLGGENDLAVSVTTGFVDKCLEYGDAASGAAKLGKHGHASYFCGGVVGGVGKKSSGTCRLTVGGYGQNMIRSGIDLVDLQFFRHLLFVDKHPQANHAKQLRVIGIPLH